ncbi:MAG: glycosyltransferase [Bdellovibrionales bacterium]
MKREVLFVSDAPISDELTGSLVSQQIVQSIGTEKIAFLYTPGKELLASGLARVHTVEPEMVLVKPRERVPTGWGRALASLFGFMMALSLETWWRWRWKIVLKRAFAGRVRWGWIVLQGQTALVMAEIVRDSLKIPVVVHVWDHIDWWTKSNSLPPFLRRYYRRKFQRVLERADFVVGPSPEFVKRFAGGREESAMHLVFSRDPGQEKTQITRDPKFWLIGFAGQMYAEAEVNSLLSALDKVNWRINDRPVHLLCVGRGHTKLVERVPRGHGRFPGWLGQDEMETLLAGCDLLYCPYPMSADFRDIVETSFPSKLVNYMSSGRPILFHGGASSAPAKWLGHEPFFHLLSTLDEHDIIAMLQKSLDETVLENGLHREFSLLNDEFSTTTFKQRVLEIRRKLTAEAGEVSIP